MLRIRNLNIEIFTDKRIFFFKSEFNNGVNIITSEENTSGKSSVISAIIYALGMEEIIGGKGSKVLSAAFNNTIKDEKENNHKVIGGKIYLEIFNGNETVTLYRSTNDEDRSTNLITIYYSNLKDIYSTEVKQEDMYLHVKNSAQSAKGFYTFLENFMGLTLPRVPSQDGDERKLYLQFIFASMFIEQKRGWSDILSRVPNYGVVSPKKRVIEYILNLDSLNNEKALITLNNTKKNIESEWKELFMKANLLCESDGLALFGVNNKPEMIVSDNLKLVDKNDDISLEKSILDKEAKINQIELGKKINLKDEAGLQNELNSTLEDLQEFEKKVSLINKDITLEKYEIKKLINGIEIIQDDIRNNQDISKLVEFGSKEKFSVFEKICPTCHQSIEDTLLDVDVPTNVMSSEENISHLKSQMVLFQAIVEQKKNKVSQLEYKKKELELKGKQLRVLIKTLRNDIYSLSGEYSESDVYKKVILTEEVRKLKFVKQEFAEIKIFFNDLGIQWKQYLEDRSNQDKEVLSTNDKLILNDLRAKFVSNLKAFGYKSTNDYDKIQISDKTLLPEVMGYDMKFDSSASDHIRGIWAFTIALLETSNKNKGNHPGLIIFDEPNQHSIIEQDMEALFTKISNVTSNEQVIMGYTAKDIDAINIIDELKKKKTKIISIGKQAFTAKDQ